MRAKVQKCKVSSEEGVWISDFGAAFVHGHKETQWAGYVMVSLLIFRLSNLSFIL